MVTRAEELTTQRWVRRHLGTAAFGSVDPYSRSPGPGPMTGVVAGLALAAVVWVAPPVVDVVLGSTSSGRPVTTEQRESSEDAGRRPE